VIATTFRSGILRNERKLWIHTPYDYYTSGARYPLLVLFDGDRNVKWVPAILDNLIAQKRIPPMVAALIDNPSTVARNLELLCYPPFADFLATELVPWVRENYHGAAEAARTIAARSRYGGLAGLRRSSPSRSFRQCDFAIEILW
jgi:enterochelin esterase-like enzyme